VVTTWSKCGQRIKRIKSEERKKEKKENKNEPQFV